MASGPSCSYDPEKVLFYFPGDYMTLKAFVVIYQLSLRAGDLYTEAAEAATAAMKGRIASKYYVLADEAWAQVSDS